MLHRLLILTVVAAGAFGCDRARDNLDERKATLDERAAIEQYASAVPDTLPLQQTWIDAVKRTATLSDPETIAGTIADEVVPALERYHQAIREMPVATDALKKIHLGMVDTHGTLLADYRTFATGLTADNYGARRDTLVRGIEAFHAAQLNYRNQLSEYYADRGFDLEPAPPIR